MVVNIYQHQRHNRSAGSSQGQLINGAFVSGGILTTTGGGTILGINTGLADLTNNGNFVINDTNSTGISGTITNNGNIALNSTGISQTCASITSVSRSVAAVR